jgi:transketolase
MAFGKALKTLGDKEKLIIGLDADMKNSTMTMYLQEAHPEQFIDCFIAEQNLVGVSLGVGCRGRIPFCATFSAFLSRAYDQIRMAAVSQANIKFVGSHCGVSIGPDGPSQMGLEDIAMMRAVPEMTILYPSDPVSAQRATELAANHKGMFFLRVSRPE